MSDSVDGAAIGAYATCRLVDGFVIGQTAPASDAPTAPVPDVTMLGGILPGDSLLMVVFGGITTVLFGVHIVWGHLSSRP